MRSSNRAGRGQLGVLAVHGVDAQQRRVLLVATGGPGHAGDVVALAQAELAGLLHRHVHVVAARQVAVHAQEAVALVTQVEEAGDGHRLTLERLLDGLALTLAGPAGLVLGAAIPR